MIDREWIIWAIPIIWTAACSFKTLRDLKGISKRQQANHGDLLSVLRSHTWADTPEKQDAISKLK